MRCLANLYKNNRFFARTVKQTMINSGKFPSNRFSVFECPVLGLLAARYSFHVFSSEIR
jgi:hypothetical protein